jgi:hypothetical protein
LVCPPQICPPALAVGGHGVLVEPYRLVKRYILEKRAEAVRKKASGDGALDTSRILRTGEHTVSVVKIEISTAT